MNLLKPIMEIFFYILKRKRSLFFERFFKVYSFKDFLEFIFSKDKFFKVYFFKDFLKRAHKDFFFLWH